VVHAKPALPAGHGQVLSRPAFEGWAALARANHAAAQSWTFSVAGVLATELRSQTRREALEVAAGFSARLGVAVAAPGSSDDLIVATGHQPELYHPGVWIKDFLLQRLAEETSATAIDLVVDSDGFQVLGVSSPCMTPGVKRCQQYLAIGSANGWYASAPVPSERDLNDFCAAADNMLASLPAPAVRHHFAAFCDDLKAALPRAENLAELVTMSRRRYEEPAGSDYLELPVTQLGASRSFRTFVVDLALGAERFSEAYNAELADFRVVNKTRSPAQPFPDLATGDGSIELPLWLLGSEGRTSVIVRPTADGGVLLVGADGTAIASLPQDPAAATDVLEASGALIAPKALALTTFVRLFACDLFIHGVGGGRYDRVTDGVCRRYYGVEPPEFVVASITMYLPLGAHIVTDDEVADARARLNRLEHNPDALLGEVEFDTAEERATAVSLAAEKTGLVAAIAAPGADKKALGMRIREVNAELAALLAPLRAGMEAEVAALEVQLSASEILTDRTYPFCFWSPLEVADKAR
jgi:hypothetical protein